MGIRMGPARARRAARGQRSGALLAPLLALAGCGGGEEAATSRGAAGAPAAPEPETWLVCSDPRVDFGEVIEGATLDHEFVFENRGPQDLHVLSTRVSCGCTLTTLEHVESAGGARRPFGEGEAIAPGGRVALRTTYHTRGKSGNAPREVQIFCDQPSGVTTVTVEATILPWLQVEPSDLAPVLLQEGASHVFHHTVRSARGEPFLLQATGEGVPPQVTVELHAPRPDAEGRSAEWELVTKLAPGLPRGVYSYPIHLRTDVLHPDAPALSDGTPLYIEAAPFVSVKIVGKIGVDPPVLAFMGVAEGQTVARSLRLTSHDPGFRLDRPTLRLEPSKAGEPCPLAATAVLSARPVEGENAWDVQVLLQGLAKEVDYWFNARLVIGTGHPDEPEVKVNVSGRRTGPSQR